MDRLLRKPSEEHSLLSPARFAKFNLTENPFPSEPAVNKDSTDRRINGSIYEMEIRKKEYQHIEQVFLKQPQSSPNHLRLGYIIDTSYIGRGNGKSAFLINLQQAINREYCLDISNGLNKCFAAYVRPEPGGRTKTFPKFVDVFFQSILRLDVIKVCLAILRLEATAETYPEFDLSTYSQDEKALVQNLSSRDWFKEHNLDTIKISEAVYRNKYLQDLPEHFPLFAGRNTFLSPFVSQTDFMEYYLNLKGVQEKINFVFSHLVQFFLAASFNGAYVLVDDFERIPDFQSARQKKDFAVELRSCLFDGTYTNARIGFYNFLLVLHAGVPRLISDAWAASGMENRSPILPQTTSKHIIPFERLSREYGSLLVEKYLSEYRIDPEKTDELFPFTQDAVNRIGELCEYNAGKMLKMAYDLLDRAANTEGEVIIDPQFVTSHRDIQSDTDEYVIPPIESAESIDLLKKARG